MNKLVITVILTILSGCGGGTDETQPASPLIGVWITESCEQASDSNGTLVNIWLKALYEFTTQGEILIGREEYSDSNCVTHNNTVEPTTLNTSVTYQDRGTKLLQEGIDGGGLLIEMGTGNQFVSVDAFYTINNSLLCFSDAFAFEALGFGVSESGTDAIDFNNCLIMPQQ